MEEWESLSAMESDRMKWEGQMAWRKQEREYALCISLARLYM